MYPADLQVETGRLDCRMYFMGGGVIPPSAAWRQGRGLWDRVQWLVIQTQCRGYGFCSENDLVGACGGGSSIQHDFAVVVVHVGARSVGKSKYSLLISAGPEVKLPDQRAFEQLRIAPVERVSLRLRLEG